MEQVEEEVLKFLKKAKLEEYYEKFREENVQYEDIREIEESDLLELIPKPIHRKRFLRHSNLIDSENKENDEKSRKVRCETKIFSEQRVIETLKVKCRSKFQDFFNVPVDIGNDELLKLVVFGIVQFELKFPGNRLVDFHGISNLTFKDCVDFSGEKEVMRAVLRVNVDDSKRIEEIEGKLRENHEKELEDLKLELKIMEKIMKEKMERVDREESGNFEVIENNPKYLSLKRELHRAQNVPSIKIEETFQYRKLKKELMEEKEKREKLEDIDNHPRFVNLLKKHREVKRIIQVKEDEINKIQKTYLEESKYLKRKFKEVEKSNQEHILEIQKALEMEESKIKRCDIRIKMEQRTNKQLRRQIMDLKKKYEDFQVKSKKEKEQNRAAHDKYRKIQSELKGEREKRKKDDIIENNSLSLKREFVSERVRLGIRNKPPPSETKIFVHYFKCNICKSYPIICSRFKSLNRSNVNLCEDCFEKRIDFEYKFDSFEVFEKPGISSRIFIPRDVVQKYTGKYSQQLEMLEKMGIGNSQSNLELLVKNNGKLKLVVDEILKTK